MTYSLLARDTTTGDIGVAVQSHFFAVGGQVPWAAAGVGAVATQAIVEPSYGPQGLALMERGVTPGDALAQLVTRDPAAAHRQVALMNTDGITDVHTGEVCIPAAGHTSGNNLSTHANLVESETTWQAMAETFHTANGDLAHRMLTALRAAEDEGGDIRGRQAAAMIVVRGTATGDLSQDRPIDLRVDDHPDPLDELERLLDHAAASRSIQRILQTDGLLSGEHPADETLVSRTLDELDAAQRQLGRNNPEPTVWKGLVLARHGQRQQAQREFERAQRAEPRSAELVRRLARAGMGPSEPGSLPVGDGPC